MSFLRPTCDHSGCQQLAAGRYVYCSEHLPLYCAHHDTFRCPDCAPEDTYALLADLRARCAAAVRAQPFAPDTKVGTRQADLRERCAAAVEAEPLRAPK